MPRGTLVLKEQIEDLSGVNTGDQVGDGTTLTGAGTIADPFVVVQQVGDGVTITGAGTIADPFVSSGGSGLSEAQVFARTSLGV